jgi:pimeloyl-ACP methyl ester carboxylesterase
MFPKNYWRIMNCSASETSHQLILQPLIQQPSAPSSKIERIWNFVYECILKEFGSCLRHVWYRMVFWIDPHKHGLNPVKIKNAQQINQTAKIVLLLHGAGAHQSSFVPMAKKLSEAKIENIFTVSLQQSNKDPIPVATLAIRINELSLKYLQQGYGNVDFALVGHSLGALAASKYIWREVHPITPWKISAMISIAGRLKYVQNKFSWFCEDVKPEIERTYNAISQSPNKVRLYSIWGDGDAIVPKQSAHIQGESSREYTVKGWGHGGIVFAPDTHQKVVSWIQEWLQNYAIIS